MSDARAQILEGLNVFRALEAWGAKLYAAWAESESDTRLRAGHLLIAEREANHARLLAERVRSLGGQPAAACVDDILDEQFAELKDLCGFVAQLDGLKRVTDRDKQRMAGCQQALDRGFEAAKVTDPSTHRFWLQLYGEERVSATWYRHTYSEMIGKRPRSDTLPTLAPDQVVRRAEAAAATSAAPTACATVA